ncbi:uncharacterized protein F5891DRAFT_1053735 [Suillus fuscotomentosus]|uniref:Secreted protein n=1 Tax=Suillus fuscotomentosus TaxID=1912939 RepID=A0AAD4HG60_9AGAM|nr:uncharacterized protein F5891DRAFT_1053735 [Suillus fuscotomentosus]KAG1896415.1 hypothetical protein F5891DRAFT_1053735 [Suillus fuscotomentosus]
MKAISNLTCFFLRVARVSSAHIVRMHGEQYMFFLEKINNGDGCQRSSQVSISLCNEGIMSTCGYGPLHHPASPLHDSDICAVHGPGDGLPFVSWFPLSHYCYGRLPLSQVLPLFL